MVPPPITLEPIGEEEVPCAPPEPSDPSPVDMGSVPSAPIGLGIVLPPDTETGKTCGAPLCSPSVPEVPVGGSVALISLGNRVYQFTHFMRVPVEGTMWLLYGNVSTASAGLLLNQNTKLRGWSIVTNTADDSDLYVLELLAKTTGDYGIVREMELPIGDDFAYDISLYEEIAAEAQLAMRIRRESGAGPSSFHNVTVSLELRDV